MEHMWDNLQADFDASYEVTFIPWLNRLREHLLMQYPLEDGIEPIPVDCLLPPKVTIALKKYEDHPNGRSAQSPESSSNVRMTMTKFNETYRRPLSILGCDKQETNSAVELQAILECNQRITPHNHWQDVRHLSFSARGSYCYAPGDILTIFPKNAPEDVDQIIDLMEWNEIAESRIRLLSQAETTSNDPPASVSIESHDSGLTLRTLLTDYVDLNSIPRRSFFSLIANFTKDDFQKERLLEFTNPKFIDELYNYTTRPRRSILEVLQEFDTVRIPWQWAAAAFPKLRGRHFSIASGGGLKYGEDGSTRFELLVAIVKYKTVIKKVRQGICTRYLAGLTHGTSLRVSLQKGDLGVVKSDSNRPVLMIGAGTGVAPMRSLIWERLRWEQLSQHSTNGAATQDSTHLPSKTVLLYGSRNRHADFFFSDEWRDLQQKIPLQVFTAFSRDQKEKRYVQDLVKEQAKLVYELLHDGNGVVYVCGSSGRMPLAVRESLIEVFQQTGTMERARAEVYLAQMEKEGRYKQETW